MKRATIIARMEALAKEKRISKGSNGYKAVMQWLELCDNAQLIRTGHYNGSGRWSSASSCMAAATWILTQVKVKYSSGNDAPRGGVTGEWIKIETKFEETKELLREKAERDAQERAKREAEYAETLRKNEEYKRNCETTYNLASHIDFSQLVNLEGWQSNWRKECHVVAHKIGVPNNDGFKSALKEYIKSINQF